MNDFSPLEWLKLREAIRPPLSSKLDYALEAYQTREFDEAARRFRRFLEELEGPENLTIRGCLYFCIGEMHRLQARFDDAARAFERAAEFLLRARDRPRRGASLRMAGLMHALLGNYEEAERLYRQASEIFNELWRECCGMRDRPYANRYGIWAQELHLQVYLLRSLLMPPPREEPARQNVPPAPPGDALKFYTLPVLTSIAAGKGYALGSPPQPEDYLLAEELILNDTTYEIHSLSLYGERQVRLHRDYKYFVARVTGDSMNDARPVPIIDGDLVIIRAVEKIESPEGQPLSPRALGINDGDIIAVEERRQPDDYGRLKRYQITSGQEVLVSESTTYYPEEEYDPTRFYIIGKAIAVLKAR